jgi:hypothetical protein
VVAVAVVVVVVVLSHIKKYWSKLRLCLPMRVWETLPTASNSRGPEGTGNRGCETGRDPPHLSLAVARRCCVVQ